MDCIDLLVLDRVDLKTRLRTDFSWIDDLWLVYRHVVWYVATVGRLLCLLLLWVDDCLHYKPPLSLIGASTKQLPLLLALINQDLVLILDRLLLWHLVVKSWGGLHLLGHELLLV